MSWQEDFERISKSPVFLEEEQHVYIHKETGERYTSVTTILSLIKNEFPHGVVDGLIRRDTKFVNWLNRKHYSYETDRETFLMCLELYLNYKEFRTPIGSSTFNGKTYPKYKELSSYKTLGEFLKEFRALEEKYEVERKKNIYINSEGKVMSNEEIKQFWLDITAVANIYGTMVHEIVEQYILLKQRFVKEHNIDQRINEGFYKLQDFLKEVAEKYPNSTHTFEEYHIDMGIEEFKKHIIDSFNALKADLGRICVPERLMFNEKYKISGMCDVFIENCDMFFSIGDHKTNKNFTMKSEYGNKLKPPFDYLDECDLVLYNLQLSIYALLYEMETGKKLKDMWISYYSRKEKKFIYIPLEYKRKEAQELLELHKNHLEKIRVKYNNKGILDNVPEIYHNHLMFLMEKIIKKHRAQGFYEDKSKTQIEAWFVNFIKEYVESQEKILIQ